MARRGEKGFALLIVLWIMVLITIVAFEISLNSRQEVNITRNYKKYASINHGARSATANFINYILTNSKDNELMDFKENEKKVFYQKLNDCSVIITMIDEGSKLDINTVKPNDLMKVFGNIGVEDETARAIIDCIYDWMDSDDLHRLNGAEDEYYESLTIPYEAKDEPLGNIFELLLVKGITPEMFYGESSELIKAVDINTLKADARLYELTMLDNEAFISEDDLFMGAGLIDFLSVGTKPKKPAPVKKKVPDIKEINSRKEGKAVKPEKAETSETIFGITVEALSDDESVRDRVYAKVLVDLSSKEKYKFLEYKEGF